MLTAQSLGQHSQRSASVWEFILQACARLTGGECIFPDIFGKKNRALARCYFVSQTDREL